MKKSRMYLILAALVTVFIFSNSAQSAAQSSELSGGLLSWIIGTLPFLEPILSMRILRKIAHFTEFFVQGVFLSLSGTYSKRGLRQSLSSIALTGLLTACCDELLQIFSPGRSPMVIDIFIDFSGTLLAMAVVALIAIWRCKNAKL